MKQTLESIAAIRCRIAAKAMRMAASALDDIDSGQARQHSAEMRGASEIAMQWSSELDKLHMAAIGGEGEK